MPAAPTELAQGCGTLLRAVLDAVPLQRVGVAGGDTSSYALGVLDAWGLAYGGTLAPGVPLCRIRSDAPHMDGLEIMLKGGQMGASDLFDTLVHGNAAPPRVSEDLTDCPGKARGRRNT